MSGEEFIIYDQTDIRKDPLGKIKRYYRGGLDTYPIPIPHYEIRIDPEQGYAKEKHVSGIDDIKTGYSIKFSK